MPDQNFYFDEMMPRVVAEQLRQHGHTVVLAVDVNMVGKDDLTEHLTCATERRLILVTRDRAFAGRAMSISDHAGVICWTGSDRDFGGMIHALNSFAEQHQPEAIIGKVFWLK